MRKLLVISVLVFMMLGLFSPSSTVIAPRQEVRSPTADSLGIIHPHTAEFVDWVVDDFKIWYKDETGNDITVTTIPKSSSGVLEEVEAWNATAPGADIMWGGGQYNFEEARGAFSYQPYNLLVPYEVAEHDNIVSEIGDWKNVDDTNTTLGPYWYAAAISGFGIMYNTEVLTAEGLDIPTTWMDLTDGQYYGQIVMCDPGLSGSTTATVLMLLQEFCDQTDATEITGDADTTEAWQFWAKIAGNVGEFVTSSSKVPSDVNAGTYGIGITIDYYAWDYMQDNTNIGFNWGGASTFSPDPVAILKGAANMEQAEYFMEYLLGTRGQSRVGKYRTPANCKATVTAPVMLAYNNDGTVKTGYPVIEPFSSAWYNTVFSRARKLFTTWFVENHAKAKKAWGAIVDLEAGDTKDDAIEAYTKLPSDLNGTLAGTYALLYKDADAINEWKEEGAANFDEAYDIAKEEEGLIPGFESLFVLVGLIPLVAWRRKQK
ncbi:MAG: ABC transporter substrate-binding protein [Candidatus Hodarchaeota archaeon]